MEKSDYSMYKYYKGSEEYPNKKAAFFGFYEKCFENTYKGTPEDKEEAFKDYMAHLLYEQASDMCMFGSPRVNESKKYGEYLSRYFDTDSHLEYYENYKG
ncbi:MAG: hypothetical protein LBG47_03725 [Prevotellaceae bacterium]|jgi:hypothetical protein|nr:hypothetical protein [Prevotellaceae bacterium]